MKDKIGIITFHKACNYGAILQTYALQTILKKFFFEYDVEVIDYYCPAIEDRTSPFYFINDGNFVKNTLRFMHLFIPKYKKYKLFRKFRKQYICETKTRYDENNIEITNDKFIAIFTGSDQVWNLNATKGDKNYFLSFASEKIYKCSYAASFGFDEIIDEYYDELVPLMKKFDYISLRENIGITNLFKRNKIKTYTNLDPTMLLTSRDWDALIVNTKRKIHEKYILLYCVLKTKRLIDYAKQLSEKTGLPVYSISNHSDFSCFHQLKSCSVEDFVCLIKNATYVLTTSFHGTVFSILYHKKFVTEIDTVQSKNTRVENLLNILEISNRAIDSSKFYDINKIEWSNVDLKLHSYVGEAEEYLGNIKRTMEGERRK